MRPLLDPDTERVRSTLQPNHRSPPLIHTETRDSITILRMEHGKVNAVDIKLFHALDAAFDRAVESDTQAIVLTGSGPIFSAGVDLFQVLEGGAGYLRQFLPVLSASVQKVFTLPLPVVAAVGGHALAGGCILAAACDRRVMSRGKGKIGVTELAVGVPYPAMALEALRWLLPHQTVQDLVYAGRMLNAEQALDCGLVDELAGDPEATVERAVEIATGFGRIPRDSFLLAKRQLRQPALDRAKAMADLDDEVIEVWSRPATLDIIRRFLDKTVGRK
nr:putative enoyl-CoA hydratase [Nerophis lumbriciformis]